MKVRAYSKKKCVETVKLSSVMVLCALSVQIHAINNVRDK